MENLFSYVSPQLNYALGWMVIHSLWQGVLIAVIVQLGRILLRKRSAQARYVLHNLALVAVLVSAIFTFAIYWQKDKMSIAQSPETIENQLTVLDAKTEVFQNEGHPAFAETAQNTPFSASRHRSPVDKGFLWTKGSFWDSTSVQNALSTRLSSIIAYLNKHTYFIVTVWLMGMSLFLLRLLGGVSYVYYLKSQHNFFADEYWQMSLDSLSKKAGLRKSLDLMESALVRSPMVIGYLKPVILFPIGLLNRLNSQEVEAILAHEIAHILRHDYLFNMLQTVIEALFYYHPVVWWLSAKVRTERENCCDDLAIRLIGSNSVDYAKSLVAVQEVQLRPTVFALGFAGQGHSQFFERMHRLLNHSSSSKTTVMEKLITTSFIIITLVVLGLAQRNQNQTQDSANTQSETINGTIDVPEEGSVKLNTEGGSKHIQTSFGDTSIPRFYSPIPTTAEIERLKREWAEMDAALPAFEKRKEAEIAELEKEARDMEAEMPKYEQAIAADIAKLEKELADMKKMEPADLEADKKEIAQIEANIAKREKEISVAEVKIKEENAKLKLEIEAKKKQREGKSGWELRELNNGIHSMMGELQANQGDLQAMRGEIQALRGEIMSIKGSAQGRQGEWQGKYGEIQGRRGELQGHYGELQGKRGEIMGKRGEIMGRYGEVQGKAGEIEGKIAENIFKTILADLKADNIITDDTKLTIHLDADEFIVNDVKQPDAIFQKYKAKYVKIPHWHFYLKKRYGQMNISIGDENDK